VLAVRLGSVPEQPAARITQIDDGERLVVLLERAVTARDMAEFEHALE
jgi:hypothetical protein